MDEIQYHAAHAAVDALRPSDHYSLTPENRMLLRDTAIERMNKYLSDGVKIDWNYVGGLVERCYEKSNQDMCGND